MVQGGVLCNRESRAGYFWKLSDERGGESQYLWVYWSVLQSATATLDSRLPEARRVRRGQQSVLTNRPAFRGKARTYLIDSIPTQEVTQMADEYCRKCKVKLTTCPTCKGKGTTDQGGALTIKHKPCPNCNGTGKLCPSHGSNWGWLPVIRPVTDEAGWEWH